MVPRTNSESPARWLPAPSRTPASSGVRSAGRRGLQRRHLGWDFTGRELRGLKGGVGTLERENFLAAAVLTAKYLVIEGFEPAEMRDVHFGGKAQRLV